MRGLRAKSIDDLILLWFFIWKNGQTLKKRKQNLFLSRDWREIIHMSAWLDIFQFLHVFSSTFLFVDASHVLGLHLSQFFFVDFRLKTTIKTTIKTKTKTKTNDRFRCVNDRHFIDFQSIDQPVGDRFAEDCGSDCGSGSSPLTLRIDERRLSWMKSMKTIRIDFLHILKLHNDRKKINKKITKKIAKLQVTSWQRQEEIGGKICRNWINQSLPGACWASSTPPPSWPTNSSPLTKKTTTTKETKYKHCRTKGKRKEKEALNYPLPYLRTYIYSWLIDWLKHRLESRAKIVC